MASSLISARSVRSRGVLEHVMRTIIHRWTIRSVIAKQNLLQFRGEQAASALEANLNNLENKLDALLAAMDAVDETQTPTKNKPTGGTGGKGPESSKTEKASEDMDKTR